MSANRPLFLIVMIMCVLFSLSASSAAPVGHNHRRRSQRHERYPASRGEKTPKLQLLPFDKVALLAQRQRIRYVHLLREAIVQAEREQIAFHSEQATAMNDGFSRKRDLYAMLFLPSVNAAGNNCLPGDPCDLAGRGLYCTDKCIYGGYLSQYPKCGSQQPFKCKRAVNCPQGVGELCNPYVYGIPPTSQNSCVPIHEEYRATQECYHRMKQLASSDQAFAHDSALASKLFFHLDQCALSSDNPGCKGSVEISKAKAEGPHARQLIDDLSAYSASDEAYAELIGVVELYKKNGWPLPTTKYDQGTAGGLSSVLDPNKFENSLNSVVEGVKEVFSEEENHCNQRLTSNVCTAIQNYKPGDYGVHRRVLIDRELRRQQRLAGRTCGSSGNATVRNVLEHQECIQLDERIQAMNKKAGPIMSSLPVPPPPAPPPPAPHEVDQSYGCASVFRDDSGLFQPAAQCSVCLSENMANRYGYALDLRAQYFTRLHEDPAKVKKLQHEARKM